MAPVAAFERKNSAITASGKSSPALLIPSVQTGSVDVSDIAHLRGAPLRKVLVERARALKPLLESNAVRTEQERRVPDENIVAIRAAGLFKLLTPRRFGGLETDFRTQLEVTRELGMACGSTAWVTALMNTCSYMAGLGSAEAQEDIWGENHEARVAGVFAPLATTGRVDGGLVVTGKWPWSSGCLHSDWAMVGVPLVDQEGVVVGQGLAFTPMSDCTIEDTWYVAGMKGSGSNTIVAENVFVPDHRIIDLASVLGGVAPTPYADEALYRSAFIPSAVVILAGPQLGLCSRALEFVPEKAPSRSVSYTFYDKQTASPTFQVAMARAAMLIDSAHMHAYRAADDIDAAAQEGRFPSYAERARIRMDIGFAVETGRNAIDILLSAHGAGSFAEASPMQRLWRDAETASRHAVSSPDIAAEVYGRALLGFTDGVTALV
ncbi:MAG: oxidoreductase [Sphingomonadales bacterium]|nr:oxidoreductase [Sphingomonadales bacterium]